MLRYVMLCYVMYVMFVMLCYVMLCYVMLCYMGDYADSVLCQEMKEFCKNLIKSLTPLLHTIYFFTFLSILFL